MIRVLISQICLSLAVVSMPLAPAFAQTLEDGKSIMQSEKSNRSADRLIVGTWQGALDVNGMKLPLVFTFAQASGPHANSAKLDGTMLSPAQSAKSLVIDEMSYDEKTREVSTSLIAIKAAFKGTLAGDIISGKFTQGGATYDLALRRVAKFEPPSRKQEPVKPYPYKEIDVSFSYKDVTLAGTLTLPEAGEHFPAVILIAGSGPHGRDEQIFFHKPFLLLADYLTRRGIAVLRYDKRGIDKSTGSYAKATTLDFADDAQAAVEYLKTRAEIDAKQIGLVGHSEGGVIAPIVASRDGDDIAFIVSLAGSAFTGEKILLSQTEILGRASGTMTEAQLKESVDQADAVYQIVKTEPDDKKALAKLQALHQSAEAGKLQAIISPWYRCFMTLDPVPYWRQVKCPVLAINGAKDVQVTPDDNLAAISAALQSGGNEHVTVEKIAGVNHLFQTIQGKQMGLPGEYSEIEETMSPAVMAKVADWIKAQTRTQNQAYKDSK